MWLKEPVSSFLDPCLVTFRAGSEQGPNVNASNVQHLRCTCHVDTFRVQCSCWARTEALASSAIRKICRHRFGPRDHAFGQDNKPCGKTALPPTKTSMHRPLFVSAPHATRRVKESTRTSSPGWIGVMLSLSLCALALLICPWRAAFVQSLSLSYPY